MSYDLYFHPKNEFTLEAFSDYFSDRARYSLDGDQAMYENDDTGVYFSFQFSDGALANELAIDEEVEAQGERGPSVAFNINFFRPHYFALEAAPELQAFDAAFSFSISDPQNEGMEGDQFNLDGFFRGWNAGNRFAYRSFLSMEDRPTFHTLPTRELTRIWRWNYLKATRQSENEDTLFVPRIMFFDIDGEMRTACVWPDACPIFMPRVDVVIVYRKEFADGIADDDEPEATGVNWEAVEKQIRTFLFDEEMECFRLEYDDPPERLREFVRGVPRRPIGPESGIGPDKVLNADWEGIESL